MQTWRDNHALPAVVAKWIRIFEPSAADAYALLEPLLDVAALGDAAPELERYSTHLPPVDRAELIIPEVRRCMTADPRRDYVAAVVRSDPSRAPLIAAVTETYSQHPDALTAARLIELAAALQPAREDRLLIVRTLITPALTTADPSVFDAVLRSRELARELPADIRRPFRDALRASARAHGHEQAAEQLLDDLGYKKRSIPVVGRKQDV
jgi:hypothetical protein